MFFRDCNGDPLRYGQVIAGGITYDLDRYGNNVSLLSALRELTKTSQLTIKDKHGKEVMTFAHKPIPSEDYR